MPRKEQTKEQTKKQTKEQPVHKKESSFYQIQDETILGAPVNFSLFKGKVCLLINSACNCGLAKEGFKTVREAKKQFPEIEVLLFPSSLNSFVDQEKKSTEEIIELLKKEKVYELCTVFKKRVASQDEGPLKWVCKKAPGFLGIKMLKWNFTKFLVSQDGNSVKRFSPTSEYAEILPEIKEYLKKQISK